MRATILASAFLALVIFLAGCGNGEVRKTENALIVWKSPSFRYADMGFVSYLNNGLEIQIYNSGTAAMKLSIKGDTICTGRFSCMPKKEFNSKFLSKYYPADIVENIFRKKPIFDAVSLSKRSNGFTQKISKAGLYKIDYKVLNNKIVFSDTINHILIKVSKQ